MNKLRIVAIAAALALPMSVLAQNATQPAPTPNATSGTQSGKMDSGKKKMKKHKKAKATGAAPEATKAPAK